MTQLCVVVALSEGYLPHLVASLQTIPAEVSVVAAWAGPGPAPSPEQLHPRLRFVLPRRRLANFERSYLLNVAARHCGEDYLLLADADHLYPDFFFRTVRLDTPTNVIQRFYLGRLAEDATAEVLAGRRWDELFCDYQGSSKRLPWGRIDRLLASVAKIVARKAEVAHKFQCHRIFKQIVGVHNPCVYPRSLFFDLRGYDERYVGWGYEDDDLTHRGRLRGAVDVRLPLIVGHLYHGAESPDYEHYRSNATGQALFQASNPDRDVNTDGWGDVAE